METTIIITTSLAFVMSFIFFLLFSGLMMLFFKAGTYQDQYRNDRPMAMPALIGAAAGLIGVGGGGLI